MVPRLESLRCVIHAVVPTVIGSVATLGLALTATAHPGHGVTPDGDSAAHYLLEPLHGLGLVVVIALAAVAAASLKRLRGSAERSGNAR